MPADLRNRAKKALISVFALAFFFTVTNIGVLADTVKDSTPVDFVLVLDCSGTMLNNDPEGWTAKAAEDFVNLIGTENVRISVIAMGHNYGSDAYPVGQSDPKSRNKVKVAFPIESVTDDVREEAIKAIREVTSQRRQPGGEETMTPIGYALQAANEVLEDGGSADDHAAIILLSDGQVDGQTDYVEKGNKKDFRSINEACDNAAEHNWPIYCLELNYEQENREGDGFPGIAYHQMRENIPSRTGTEPFEVTSAENAKSKLFEIYNSFFDNATELKSGSIKVTEDTREKFSVGEMTAEQTIILSGDVKQLQSIGLISPDGSKSENYEVAKGNIREKLRKITFDDKSIVLKMVMPQEGEWTLTLSGSGGVTLDYDSVSLKQMNLVLDSDYSGDLSISGGEAIPFKAYFEYADIRYESSDFFNKYPAVLHVGDETIRMDSTEEGYETSYQFQKMGTYHTYVQVDAPFFKDGYRRSGELIFNVENTQTSAKGEIPEQSCGVFEKTSSIDLNQYFDAGDGDDLTFTIKKNPRDDFDYELSGNLLVLKANGKSKVYKLFANASDGSGEKGAEQVITFRVTNQPIELLIDNEEEIKLVPGADKIPGFVLKLAKANKDSGAVQINWADCFNDPDGAKPEIRVLEDSNDGIVDFEESDDGLFITAKKDGKAEYTIIAIDGNDDSVYQFILLDIVSKSAGKGFIIAIVILILIVLIILFVTFGGRKIYGTWDVNCNGIEETDITISGYRHGKGSSVEINAILADLNMDGGFNKARLKAGNQFGKKVFLCGFNDLDSVLYNDIEIEDFRKMKSKEIRTGSSVTLENNGNIVVFTRIS